MGPEIPKQSKPFKLKVTYVFMMDNNSTPPSSRDSGIYSEQGQANSIESQHTFSDDSGIACLSRHYNSDSDGEPSQTRVEVLVSERSYNAKRRMEMRERIKHLKHTIKTHNDGDPNFDLKEAEDKLIRQHNLHRESLERKDLGSNRMDAFTPEERRSVLEGVNAERQDYKSGIQEYPLHECCPQPDETNSEDESAKSKRQLEKNVYRKDTEREAGR